MKHNVTVSKEATMSAIGELNSSKCKPTFCITDFLAYTSVTDAGNDNNICSVTISQACNGQVKTAGKKEWCFIADLPLHYDKLIRQYHKLLDYIKELEPDAAVGRAIREAEEARLEAERKAEEERQKELARIEEEKAKKQMEIAKAEQEYEKANKRTERRKHMAERALAEYQRILDLLDESENAKIAAARNLALIKENA